MVRPERTVSDGGSCCIELTGASPVAVSADAPRSRPRAREEILPPEWGVKGPRSVVCQAGGEQVRRPSEKRSLQPREINTRKVVPAEPLIPRRRQQTALAIGWTQDGRGVGSRACGHSSMRNRRDPSRRPTSGEGAAYKPKVKWRRAGRESEGFIVPMTPVSKGRSREGTLLWSWRREEVSVRAWPQGPTTPWDTTTARAMPSPKRENSTDRLYTGAKCLWRDGALCLGDRRLTPGGTRNGSLTNWRHACAV